ncbi:hypothetical protein [Chromobacterium violaceum]|nr:hypothetical protein [Chromobacterium violaceum]
MQTILGLMLGVAAMLFLMTSSDLKVGLGILFVIGLAVLIAVCQG